MSEQLEKDLINLTSQLIRFKTVDGNYSAQRKCIQFIAQYLSTAGDVYFSHHTHHDYPSLVVTNTDTKKPDVLLNGHIDVVPGLDSDFMPYIEGGRLYGRGAMDMKGGVATIMKIFCDVADHPLAPSVGLMITSDEERGGCSGVRHLVQDHGWGAKFVLTPEGKDSMVLVIREKGACWIKLKAHGTSAHSAQPWQGDNAVDKVIHAYERLQSLFPKPSDSWQSTISISGMSTKGSVYNQVPDYAEAIVDVRYTEDMGRSIDEVFAKLKQVVPEVEVELIVNGEMLDVPENNKYLRRLKKVASEVVGHDVPFGYNHGASDAKWFTVKGIPAVVSGIVGGGHHAPDEYVETESLVQYYNIVRTFILPH